MPFLMFSTWACRLFSTNVDFHYKIKSNWSGGHVIVITVYLIFRSSLLKYQLVFAWYTFHLLVFVLFIQMFIL